MIDLPEVQMALFRAVAEVNPNIVVVLFNGRPLDLREISEKSRAVLEVWLPGTEGGHAECRCTDRRSESVGQADDELSVLCRSGADALQ